MTAVFTNTAPVDAYRGAGRPEATYVVERLVATAATEMKIAQDEIRRRNFIRTFPYQTPVALQYDIGDYDACLDGAMKMADVAGFPARKAASAKSGKLRGLGYASYIEACGLAPSNVAGALGARAGLFEAGEVRVHPTGKVTVFTGSHSHGQGHETTFAQVVADRLGMGVDDVDIVHGDTGRIPFGMGTYGSRSIAVGGTAIMKAVDKIVAKGRKIAAHLMEVSDTDVEFKDGKFTVKGTDKNVPFAQVALTAYVPHNYPLDKLEPGLDETAFYDPTNFTYPAGTHICEVEIDADTGETKIASFTACDDFGNIINPMIVEGQVHGGLTQGIGQALLEGCVYDRESGQLVTASYMDYTMPRAADVPNFKVDTRVTPCTHNPLGVKGCGEAGAIGAPAAVMNAICDALGREGCRDAGDRGARLARDPLEEIGDRHHEELRILRTHVGAQGHADRRGPSRRQVPRGRADAARGDEASPRRTLGPRRSQRGAGDEEDRGRRGYGHRGRDGAPRGSRRFEGSRLSHQGACRPRGHDRRSPGA